MFDSSAGSSLYNLGNLYGKLGRHHEALELEQKALELRKRIHPANHPAIGRLAVVVKICSMCASLTLQVTP